MLIEAYRPIALRHVARTDEARSTLNRLLAEGPLDGNHNVRGREQSFDEAVGRDA